MKVYFFTLILCLGFLASANANIEQKNQQNQHYSSDTLLLFYDETGKQAVLDAIRNYQADIVYEYQNFNSFAIRIPKEKDIEQAKIFFSQVKGILSVEKDQIMQLH
ncbi:hypothetical protein EXH44_07900 [Actinobacillus indolicus]|uniref:Inhibitor I9 domain-containing protein n=1 Tax=Actinobacillus indolicus TaxID=51049 RepID=A0A4V1AY50_9PAST|nr:protease inhibitor I9 family protein [Actinobacillus indolicus]QBQ64140.1 hypothetical protein EXH44_07900 [Actinobacillus indolicus]